MTRSESSADSPFSRWRSSRKRRVPTDKSRVSTGTPSSRMFTLVTSCPMLTSPTTPCIASGWFSSNALWIANASTSMIAASSPASPRSDVRLEDLEVELDVRHVERHVLLGLPPDHLPGVPFLHPVHLDLLDDHVPAADRRHHRPLLDAGRGKQPPDRLRHEPGVHDLTLDDGIGGDLGCGNLHELRLAAGMVDHGQLDDAGTDIQAHRGFFAAQQPEEGHKCLWAKDKKGRGQTTVSPAPYPVKPRTYLRPNQQVLWLSIVRPL